MVTQMLHGGHSIRAFYNVYCPEGKISLLRNGKLVWFGNLSDPFEDVDFNAFIVHPNDYECIKQLINAQGEKP